MRQPTARMPQGRESGASVEYPMPQRRDAAKDARRPNDADKPSRARAFVLERDQFCQFGIHRLDHCGQFFVAFVP